ncbi:MAG: hypothetical protein LAT64_11265 [Phycisphaerales bacterium]|nr:hypothetical protein [Planctomycetota bacterium]MCH8509330.1 hypothetical protein [Phycisphaerales bacterium]
MTLADARRVQAEVMDFADDMTVRLAEAVDMIEMVDHTIEARTVAHRLKYTIAHGATVIAAAQNPRIALVDMLVMITLQRALIERNIVPRYFGPEADRLRHIFEVSEQQIRALAVRSLTAEQLAEIDRLIERWLEENPDRRYAAYVRFSEFAAARQVTTGQAPSGRASNVLGFLFIDPLSGLDPTTREIEQIRLFGERAFFYLQRMPLLISWQAELLYIDTVGEPEVRQLLENAAAATESVERITAEMEALRAQLPELITAERTATIDQIGEIIDEQRQAAIDQAFAGFRAEREAMIDQLAAEQERIGSLVVDLRETIEASTVLSDSVRETAGGFSELARQLRLDEPRDPDAEPFRIQDYTEAIRETTQAAIELANLADSLSAATSPELLEERLALIEQRLVEAEASAERLMDRAFRLGVILIVVLVVGLAGVVILSARMRRA